MDKHHKVTVTLTGSLLLRLTLSLAAGSTPCPRGFSLYSCTLLPPTDKLHYGLAEQAQHLPTAGHVHIPRVGMGNNSSDFDSLGFNPCKSLLLYGTNRYGQLRIHSRIREAFTVRFQKRLNHSSRKTYYL